MSVSFMPITQTSPKGARVAGDSEERFRKNRQMGVGPQFGTGGHPRYDLLAITWNKALRLLSDCGVPLAKGNEIAPTIGRSIAWHVLGDIRAWSGDMASAAEYLSNNNRLKLHPFSETEVMAAVRAVGGPPEMEARIRSAFSDARQIDVQVAEGLRQDLTNNWHSVPPVDAEFLMVWPNGEIKFTNDITSRLAELPQTDERLGSAFTVFPLRGIASRMNFLSDGAFYSFEVRA